MQLNKLDLEVKHFDYTLDDWVDYSLEREEKASELLTQIREHSEVKTKASNLIEKLLEEPISAKNKKDIEKLGRLIIKVGKKNVSFLKMIFLANIDYLENGTRTCNSLKVELAFIQEQKTFKELCKQMSPLGKCKIESVFRTHSAGFGHRCIESLYFIPQSEISHQEGLKSLYEIVTYLRKSFREEDYKSVDEVLLQLAVSPFFM